ncbi:MAG: DUF475 domain-containing protein [Sporomusaceae bacterium]|nr:DUF475 domain-containing protein [Sporomusaceae bacterium]
MDFLEIINGVIANYGNFFSAQELYNELSDPVNWGIIFWLIVLEGLLSCDNALVLAVVVNKLPEKQRKKALLYGIWGAYFFRFVAIGLGTYLIKMKWVQILGAGYLLWLAVSYFWHKRKEAAEAKEEEQTTFLANRGGFWNSFWGVVITVELMDISFSVDSILAAFALSNEIWVLLLGGMLGILMMRGVATVFIKLLDKYPELESAAYVLIAIIGTKLLGQSFDIHVSNVALFALMAAVLGGTILLHHWRQKDNA